MANFAWNNFRSFIPPDGFTFASPVFTPFSRAIVKVWSRYALVSLAYWTGGRSGEGKRGREKYVQSVCQDVGYTGVQVSPMEKLKVEGKEDAWMDFFFFFLLPFPSTIPFYYFFSYSIPCKLRFSRVQSYSFYGREEIQTITPKFFFFCATVERNVFWIIRFSTRQNNPRAVTHFVHTKVEEKSIATIYTVHAFKSNIEGTLVPLFSISKHLYFYQVSTDHHTFLSLPSSSPPDKRARSILTVSKYIFSRCRYRRPRAESFIIDISCQPRGLYTRIIEYPYMPCHG